MQDELDRESEDAAREFVERLYPQPEIRHVCLNLLADEIVYAHSLKPDVWEVTLRGDGLLQLNVGRRFACILRKGHVYIHLEASLLPDILHAELSPLEPLWEAKLDGALQPRIPVQLLLELLPQIKEANFRIIERIAQYPKRSPYARRHHWGFIRYLRKVLDRDIPDPDYPRMTETTAGNEQAFRKALARFAEYARSERYGSEERDYKQRLIERLGQALSDDALNADDFPANLRAVIRECNSELGNLTHWTNTADFKNYLDAVPPERLRGLLQDLFDEEADAEERIEAFKNEVNADYSSYLPTKDHRIGVNLIAALLTVRHPESYVFYQRRAVIKTVCERWGMELPQGNTDGERYVDYLEFLQPIQARLTQALGRTADAVDVHSFLWMNGTENMIPVWRIAPGAQARYWEMCREKGCIAIDWLNDTDFRSFLDKGAIRQALTEAGQPSGGAPYIWAFTREINPGNIVVANKGEKTVVGVGLIQSNYIAPNDPNNTIAGDHFRHARLVDWRITKPVEVPFKFIQPTVESLSPSKWQQIKKAYRDAYPEDESLQRILDSIEGAAEQAGRETQVNPMLQKLMQICGRTRNAILYGPPGTGKTYWVREFAGHFLGPQLQAAPSGEQQRLRLLEDLTWYEAIGLAMIVEAKERYKVNDLMANPILTDFVALKKSAKPANSVWAQLQIHTGSDSKTVNYTNRNEPFLFDKDENSQWYLTAEGKEYVETNLSDKLKQLRHPAQATSQVEDYLEFVTFHQSYAYEEFVEGLRPRTDDDGQMRYEIIDGIFKRICLRAERDRANNYILVIDEINRANIAKVFGELITLLEDDKRLGQEHAITATLPYSGKPFGVPDNLYVLGTMNTADRSIALLDLALRRRFSFIEMLPDTTLLNNEVVEGVNLSELLDQLNRRIVRLLDRDHQIGHSYFLKVKDGEALHFAWYHRVIPLVQEYFYNDGERLQSVLGKPFVVAVTDDAQMKASLGDLYDSEAFHYEIIELNGQPFLEALRSLAVGAS